MASDHPGDEPLERNKRLVLQLLDHWLDPAYLDAISHETFEAVVEAEPSVFPHAGKLTKEQVLERWGWARAHFPDGMAMTVKGVTAEGRRVAVEVLATGRMRVDDRERDFRNRYHFVFELLDGRLTRLVEYQDTAFALSLIRGGLSSGFTTTDC
jgi:ketosteroid isomerase-like protein